ncbi:MAG: undecaprenyl phosphate N,N'-diacetylbacillosamine 1-phosphate transferase [Oleiphilaceae bacterium]|jgi:undecaprenyl phosphate N,N'-diacetylbacillosamine 1-phosphate transferase
MYKQFLKPLADSTAALVLLLLISPVFIVVSLSLLVLNKGSVFFTQARPGKNAKVFKVIKFKTMTDVKAKDGKLLPDAERLTRVGRFVRSTSLDEIPQLINVFIGDMSLVGPRPLLVRYLDRYTPEQARRHEVKPGITGWAQVNGRNAISWNEKFKYDIFYVDNQSFFLDLKILLLTTMKVVKREDINASEGQITMSEFYGEIQSDK